MGCVPALPGYLAAMKAVCQKYGALFLLDEIMCGMGRCGTLHAWEQEGVVPDIQTMGKGLGGGYAPVSGVLIGDNVVDVLDKGSGVFRHGHTYQGHPIACAAALAVQTIIKEQNILQNVRDMGAYLETQLKAKLASHPNVGDIRGKGLFWGVSGQQTSCAERRLIDDDDDDVGRIRPRQGQQRTLPGQIRGCEPDPGNRAQARVLRFPAWGHGQH